MLDAAKNAANDIADLDYVQGDIRSNRMAKQD